MTDDAHADEAHADSTITEAESVAVNRGASASLSFDTVDATDESVRIRALGDEVGVELTVDLGAVTYRI
jgi:hypothetical protein